MSLELVMGIHLCVPQVKMESLLVLYTVLHWCPWGSGLRISVHIETQGCSYIIYMGIYYYIGILCLLIYYYKLYISIKHILLGIINNYYLLMSFIYLLPYFKPHPDYSEHLIQCLRARLIVVALGFCKRS